LRPTLLFARGAPHRPDAVSEGSHGAQREADEEKAQREMKAISAYRTKPRVEETRRPIE